LLADDVVVRPAAECKQQDRDNEEGEQQAAFHLRLLLLAWVVGHQHPPRSSERSSNARSSSLLESRKPLDLAGGFAGEATLASVGVVENAVRER
jgi:hypothetical protein